MLNAGERPILPMSERWQQPHSLVLLLLMSGTVLVALDYYLYRPCALLENTTIPVPSRLFNP